MLSLPLVGFDIEWSPADFVCRFGLSFLGAKWSEEKLIGYAYAFEQATKVREKGKPYLVPTIELQNIVGR
jgi:hypothetical protein